jgi:hypothetical protein
MAIGVATQFETMLRQRDVIGEWEADAGGRERWSGALPLGEHPGRDLQAQDLKNRR